MIEFLSEWMRGLILVIFLAVVLDMILPNNAMQRYVKLVMGLLIILLMLSPLLKMYGTSVYEIDFALDKLLAKEGAGKMQSIDQITAQGLSLQDQQSNRTVEQWKAMLSDHVKQVIEQEHAVTVDAVEARIAQDAAGKPTALDYLAVIVMSKQEKGAIKPIQEVVPVIIGGGGGQEVQKTPPGEQNATTAAILQQLSREYQLPASKISVIWQDAQGG
ncbi:stage III sporulation protein AF [Tumebacillus algifaecis]|uniref:Stage III sporulation protein AF n=1 Tax=Tumebacillus algifaecis TaxID=1214604 RepID=A0A223D2Q7_9BACL|nr:stage III sporulation protein AF [Tumebacillus algifaecis]ASS75949.1 stage III sporulation protein AF [Tumebacillus algifaecis]